MADSGDDDGFIGFVVFVGIIIAVGYFLKHKDDKKIHSSPPPVVIDQPKEDAAAITARVDAEVEQARIEIERKEQEEAAKKEKVKFKAIELADQLGLLVVKNSYGGGSNIGANLIDYEYFESESTYRLKVELGWNSTRCNESGRALAIGVITTVFDGNNGEHKSSWNPESQSDTLNEWLAKRRDPMEDLNNMTINMLGQMSGGMVSPCE